MPVQRLKAYLDKQGVKYVAVRHSPAYTAQEVAESTHIPGKELAKTVMISIDGEMAMAVVPASHRVDVDRLRRLAHASEVEIASENEFRGFFPHCDVGTMPPFGNLYDMDVYMASALSEDEEIAFNAGSHVEVVRLRYSDYERLVRPRIGEFSHRVP